MRLTLPSLLTLLSATPTLISALPPPPSYDLTARDGGIIARKNSNSHSHDGKGKTTGGAVATEAAPCSEVGIEILKQGGNAADAIIAAGLCVGTISAYHSGIGGGGFMIVRFNNEDGTHGYEQIDFRETCPGACNPTMYAADANGGTLSTIGGLAAGVPGELRGWEKLHTRHGRLGWTELFKPAIKIARDGFKVNVDLAYAIKGEDFILKDPLWAEVYAPNGTALVEGDTCYRKRYADTLEKISWYGPDWFYKGEAAVTAAAALYARGGIMTVKDLAGYEAIVRDTVNITYRGSRIFSTVAPSSGAVVLSALKIFEGYQGNYTDSDPEINVTTHRLLEATQFAYGQRTQYGDPDFTKNVTDLQQYYLTDSVVEELRAKIVDNSTFPVSYYDSSNYTATRESGTSHMAVIDSEGQAVSLTTTVNTYWGSTVMDSSGIVYNNEMDDFGSAGTVNTFGFAASPINYPAAGKRPQSSISSSIAEDLETGEILIATGSAGGSRIITATLQHLYHHLDQSLNAYECAHHPRWHDQLGGQTLFEWKDEAVRIAGYDNSTVAYLSSLGYNTTWQGTSGSNGHVAIRSKNGTLSAASDPRKAAGAGLAY